MPSFCKPDHLSSPVGLISKIFHYHVLTQPAAIGQARRIAAQSFCFAILLFSQLRIVHLSSNFWPSQQDPNFCGLDVHRFPYSNNPKHCQSASGHHFNPRTCVRCDVMPPINARSLYDFNPRTYLRCDHELCHPAHLIAEFQSTHLHKVRPYKYNCISGSWLFQSTHLRKVRLRPK